MRRKIGRFSFLMLVLLLIWGCKELVEKLLIERIDVTPACSVANIGQTQQFTALATGKDGLPVTNATFSWSSSDGSVATVSGSGLATAVKGGNAKISAAAGDATGQGLLSVNPISSLHNCRSYEWYQTQMGTGSAAGNNCGPTSTYMAVKWYRQTTSGIPTVEEIRSRHPRDGGWWYTSDISESLNYYGVPFATHSVHGESDILACLQRGRVVLLCVEMKWIAYNRHSFYDRFYAFDSGHFLVVKGRSEDGQYFIVYDPNSWNNDYYTDGTAMGRNRYYKRSELLQAVTNWWAFAFEIGAPSASSTVSLAVAPVGHAGPESLERR